MNERMTHIIVNERVDIPDIVNDKCNEAYEQIRREAKQMPQKKIRHKKRAALISIAAAAAVMCSIPVAAAFFRNGFEFVSHEVYTKNPAQKMNLAQYADDVNKSSEQAAAEVTLQSIYCDGNNISVSLMLIPENEELKGMTGISAWSTAKLNGNVIKTNPYESSNSCGIEFYGGDDGAFYATLDFQNIKVEEASELELTVSSLRGANAKLQTWVPDDPGNYYGSGTYTPEMTDTFSDKFSFEATVTPDTSNNRLYEVNDTQGDITLESILVTPFRTEIAISGLGEGKSLRVLDNDGNELEYMDNAGSENVWNVTSPLKTAKQLRIEVFSVHVDEFPAEYTFTVDIERGFAEKYTVKYDNSDVVYVPPMEELEEHWKEAADRENAAIVRAAAEAGSLPLGTPVERSEPDYDLVTEYKTTQKVIGSEIDDIENYDIDEEEWDWLADLETPMTPENTKMLLVTYEVTNETDKSGGFYFEGFDIYSEDFSFLANDPYYRPDKDHGGKSGNIYEFGANETRNITFGYLISEEYADKGFYALAQPGDQTGGYSSVSTAIEKGKLVILETE
ncbi:MAG: DUF4179 domain-containing protein [Porcipelethomonas sp.]